MFILHSGFEFETDIPGGLDLSSMTTSPGWRTVYGEVQFAAADLQPIGPNRGRLPMAERLEDYGREVIALWKRKPVVGLFPAVAGITVQSITLELVAQKIHEQAREYTKLWPLVAVHAVRLSRLADFSKAVTYLSCAVPLHVVHGQIVYKKPAGDS